MLVDYVKSLTGRVFTMNDAQPAPAAAAAATAERRAIFDQVRFQHVISDRWSPKEAEKVCSCTVLPLCCMLTVRVLDLKVSHGQWRGRG